MSRAELVGAPPAAERQALVAATVLSVLLSPLTAAWALLVGPLVMAVGGVISRTARPGSAGRLLLWAGLGVLLGSVPYFLLAVLQA